MENLNAVSHFIQHKTFSALNYAREIEWRNLLKELRIWSGLFIHEKSNCPVSNTFMPLTDSDNESDEEGDFEVVFEAVRKDQ